MRGFPAFVAVGAVVLSSAVHAAPRASTLRVDSFENALVSTSFYPTEALPEETFESFPTGNLPIMGWSSDFNPNHQIVASPTISGTRSWQHTSDGSGFADTGTSPTFTPYFGRLSSDIRITEVGTGSVYHWIPLGDVVGTPPNTFFNTRVQFVPTGAIEVLQVVAGLGVFFPTTGTFSSGETFNIGVSVDSTGELQVYKNGTSIFTGDELGFALTGTPGRLLSFNSFAANTAGGTGSTMLLDNFTAAVPEPGSLAMLGLTGLTLIRRRR